MDFHKRLKMYRNGRHLTQKAVAEAIGVSLRGYQQYEQGKFEPNIERLIQIADFYQISLDDLVGRPFPKGPMGE